MSRNYLIYHLKSCMLTVQLSLFNWDFMDNIKILFGRKIKEFRKKFNYTQAQLAEIVGVDNKHISCIESGKNFPSADLISRLALAFSIEVKDLFEFNYHKTPENLKKEIGSMIEKLNDDELVYVYKYIKTFLL